MAIQDIDRATLVFARTHGHTPRVERLVAAFSRTGEHAACWLALGLAGAAASRDTRRRAVWVRALGTAVAKVFP